MPLGSEPFFCGWAPIPEETDRILATLTLPYFAEAAHDCMAEPHRDVLFWEHAEERVFGRTLPAHAQEIGDCVSHGFAKGAEDLHFLNLAKNGETTGNKIATEPIYALSRVEIGGGRIGGDGSTGAWGAKALSKFGILERKAYGSIDLSSYSGSRARSWGRSGCPDELEPIAKLHPVKAVTLVRTGEEVAAAGRNLYPVPLCSNQGFRQTRDRYGFCDPSGSWAHCMLGRGSALVRRGGREVLAVPVQQSWGNSPTGPDEIELASGRTVKLPQGVFMVELDVIDRMARQGDSFALSDLNGFFPRVPDFRV